MDMTEVVLLGCGDVGPIHEPMERHSELVHHTLAGADIRFAQIERTYSERGVAIGPAQTAPFCLSAAISAADKTAIFRPRSTPFSWTPKLSLADNRRKAVTAVRDFSHRASLPAPHPEPTVTLTKPARDTRFVPNIDLAHDGLVPAASIRGGPRSRRPVSMDGNRNEAALATENDSQ
jgi:hypothetical protein